MNETALRQLLAAVAEGQSTVDDAVAALKTLPYESLPDVTIDHHRALRCDFPEVIYAEGKTVDQVVNIFTRLTDKHDRVLATRVNEAQAVAVAKSIPNAEYHVVGRCVSWRREPVNKTDATPAICAICAGTTDLPVLEEARITAELIDQRVQTIVDVGVAGLHRLLGRLEEIQRAKVVIVAAGMDGALPSVVGGLVSAPVIAVPTSVGYGASFNGIAPLLTMLNACAPGVSVVNIDNGFAAGYLAGMIARMASKD